MRGREYAADEPMRHDTQELNYAGICAAIAATDYGFYAGHEYKPKADLVESLKKTFALCDQGHD